MEFKFKDYDFNTESYIASFRYEGKDNQLFEEKIQFAKTETDFSADLLNRAMFLSFILIGTSYYKAHPITTVNLPYKLDSFQAKFFNAVYQEGLSQYAFENNLTRDDLAHFKSTENYVAPEPIDYSGNGILSLQSGGKDSLLTAALLKSSEKKHSFWYLGSSDNYPQILNTLTAPIQLAKRTIDMPALKATGGLNGHVPITYVVQSLALIQAILNGQNIILTSIGQEGNEAHAYIDNLPVNHQWSKTWPAEKAFAEYVHNYISKDIKIGSPLRKFTELKIAELFVKNCWQEYGHSFSSCNVANYRQQNDNSQLTWCGNCAKCANSYLLFSPFLPAEELNSIFANQDLFQNTSLTDDFKGLLGIDNHIKPFECVGEVAELRKAYELKQNSYSDLPFNVPKSDFNYNEILPSQELI